MDGNSKRHRTGEEVGGGSGGDEGGGGCSKGDFEPSMDRFPEHIKINALEKMELSYLCTVACVSPIFNSAVTHLPSDLSPDEGSEAEMVQSCDEEGHGYPSAEV
ncbi:hypothetical protein CQW23_18069 [Capsicum baccatum]|uniref:F-box domain-containing protein n=1 Tax=Capsicum baccatum TaxID=33114 RepID=A0A2G2WFN6_CAPBA|nr:hypothetical protein CQW23_18069 [Capsicum baccatum]